MWTTIRSLFNSQSSRRSSTCRHSQLRRESRCGVESLEERRLLSITPLEFDRLEPAGAIAYASQGNAGTITNPSIGDDYTLYLEAGETVTAVLDADDSITPALILYDSSQQTLAVAFEPAGETVVIQTFVVPTSDTYTVVAGSIVGTGDYSLDVFVNAAAEAVDTGPGNALAIDGSFQDIASGRYVVNGRSEAFQLLGNWQDPNALTGTHINADVWAEGNTAFVGHASTTFDPGGVDIIDISDPTNPALLTTFLHEENGTPTNNKIVDVKTQGGIGFFASDGGGIFVVDVSNPANPNELFQIDKVSFPDLPGPVVRADDDIHNVFVDGNYLYSVPSSGSEIFVYDISTPATPVWVRTIDAGAGQNTHDITVTNGLMYVSISSGSGATQIYDVSDVANQVTLLGSEVTGSFTHSNWPTVDGNYLAVARESSGEGIDIYDISDPQNITLQTTLDPVALGFPSGTLSPHNPVIEGDRLYVSWYQAGVQAFDISDPGRPIHLGGYNTRPDVVTGPLAPLNFGAWGVYPFMDDPDQVLVSDSFGGLSVFDTVDEDQYTLDLTGKEGHRLDIVLSSQEGIDLSGETLQLLDPNDVVVATAVATPLNNGNTNYNLAVLGFELPQTIVGDGQFTLRFESGAGGTYTIVVTDQAAFDSEQNDSPGDVLRDLTQLDGAVGFLGESRLFSIEDVIAPVVNPTEVVELDPVTGVEINRFALPVPVTGAAELAFAGDSLFYIGGDGFLYELDPDTGAVRDQDLLSDIGITTGTVDGLAIYGDLVVASVSSTDEIYFIDTVADEVDSTLTANVDITAGLAGGISRGSLFAFEIDQVNDKLNVVELDASTGIQFKSFAVVPQVIADKIPLPRGLAFVDGSVLVGVQQSQGSNGLPWGDVEVFQFNLDSGDLVNSSIPVLPPLVIGGDGIYAGTGNLGAGGGGSGSGFNILTDQTESSTGGIPLSTSFIESESNLQSGLNDTRATADVVPLGFDQGEYDHVNISGEIITSDIDYFQLDLNAGDLLTVKATSAITLSLQDAAGNDLTGLVSTSNASFNWIIESSGTYFIEASGSIAAYTFGLDVDRSYTETLPVGVTYTVFLDFDGATNGGRWRSPLSSFLPRWGLDASDEDAVIDAIVTTITENFYDAAALNPDFQFQILNSRDDADPTGLNYVERGVFGGTVSQAGGTLGGKNTANGAFVVLDEFSSVSDFLHPFSAYIDLSLNKLAIDPQQTTIIDLIGVGLGTIMSHELGHSYGLFNVFYGFGLDHTSTGPPVLSIMDGPGFYPGGVAEHLGFGSNGIFENGGGDDIDVDFTTDVVSGSLLNQLAELAWTLTTGTAPTAQVGPWVTGISPGPDRTERLDITKLQVQFSEDVTLASAENAANYDFREAGPDGVFDFSPTSDDVLIPLTATLLGTMVDVELVVTSQSPLPVGRYQLTIIGSSGSPIVDGDGNSLNSLTGPSGGSDQVHQFAVVYLPEPLHDLYQVTLAAGQTLQLSTETPRDDPMSALRNTLDPRLAVLDAAGNPLAQDRDSAADNKNAQLTFVAPTPGTYLISVMAESGRGSYVLNSNLSPTAAISGTTDIYRGETVTYTLTATDPSVVDQADLFTFEIDWDGDGTVDETVANVASGTTVQHTFPTVAANDIQVRATDIGGATGIFSQTPITVSPHVLRDDGQGNTDLIWGGTPGVDAVYVLGSAPSLLLFVQYENTVLVNRLDFIGAAATGKIILYGYDSDDELIAELANGNVIEIHGGDGDDEIVGGFLGDELYGDDGDDVILGGSQGTDGADLIFGGLGRDVLFGHIGADTLDGGSGEDLLVGDRLNFSNTGQAIRGIADEWRSTRPYAERVSNILGTTSTGVNGVYILDPGVTVIADGDVDTLIGGIGDIDWFFYDFLQDILGDSIEVGEEETDSDP